MPTPATLSSGSSEAYKVGLPFSKEAQESKNSPGSEDEGHRADYVALIA